jgi:hypothetical protein
MGFVVSHLRKGRSWSWSLCRNIVARPPARLPALPGRMCSLAWTGRAPVLGFFLALACWTLCFPPSMQGKTQATWELR